MATIHEQIDELVAAAVLDQLPEGERHQLHVHLVECEECRELHKEQQLVHRALEEVLAEEKPDAALERRMLTEFRRTVPRRPSFAAFLMNVLRSRATQAIAAVAILLALVQIGRGITGESGSLWNRGTLRNQERAVLAVSPLTPGKSDKSDLKSPPFAASRANQLAAATGVSSTSTSSDEKKTAGAAGKTERIEKDAEPDRAIVTGSNIPTPEEVAASPEASSAQSQAPAALPANRKLIRNASVDLEVQSFDDSLQKITTLANDAHGYVATSSSQKQENGKLRGQVIVKVVPENLDSFLTNLRALGGLKNQTLGTEDVSKQYFDTGARLKNAQAMEQRLLDILKTKTGKVTELLEVEKELGRVREQIERMQGELKFMDAQVQFATVTISLAEKDMAQAAGFLLKEHAQLSLFTGEVEKTYNDIKALATPKVQITSALLNRDVAGRVSANVSLLIAPEESDAVIAQIKNMGRVENFEVQTERVARGGSDMSEMAKTERDKVRLDVALSRQEQEAALQQTSLRIRTTQVSDRAKQLRGLVEKQEGRVLSSSFSRDSSGQEFASVVLRAPMKNYNALVQSFNDLGKVEDVSVHREERAGVQIDEATAPADLTIEVYSQGNIVSSENGVLATMRRTLSQGAAALMWSARMVGVALAFLAPWLVPLILLIWIWRRVARARELKRSRGL